MSRLKKAHQAEIIRSQQKDEYYSAYVKNTLHKIIFSFFGPRTLLKWQKELDVIGETVYFTLTTLNGLQTLGEEYVNIIQVNSSMKIIPNFFNRMFSIAFYVLPPYIIDKSLVFFDNQLQSNNELGLTYEGKNVLIKLVRNLRNIFTLLQRFHLTIFYFNSAFYHLSKRMTGIRYLAIRTILDTSKPSYSILGWISVIQLALILLFKLFSILKKSKYKTMSSGNDNQNSVTEINKIEQDEMENTRSCPLCLSSAKHITATPCGHLFCWNCIHEWCVTNADCPLCRSACLSSRLIYLQNFQ